MYPSSDTDIISTTFPMARFCRDAAAIAIGRPARSVVRVTGRLANLALLVVVPLAALTGVALFTVGGGSALLVALAHGVVGVGVVVLVPWKSVVVRRGLRRVARPGRLTSLALTFAVVLALATGVAHALGVSLQAWPVSTMQAHVAAGAVAAALTLEHARHRRVRSRRTDLSRRTLLRLGALAAVAALADLAVRGAGALASSPGERRSTGSIRLASTSVAAIPETSWLFDAAPPTDAASWRVRVTAGAASRAWTLAELARWDDRIHAVLDCTSGWWTAQEWSGVRVAHLLPPGTTGTVEVRSATGYSRRLPLTDDLLLATAVGGEPLSAGHGAPVRLVVPGRRGFHWVKWVVSLTVDDQPWWLEPPLPLH
jgi:DMSO/TMAO reductase YedYZ molybdopterin-dependent catalytic subunit